MDHDGQRGSTTPSAVLASLLSRRAKLQEELRNIERQMYDMETSYLQDPSQCGNVLKDFLEARSRKFQPEDRLFSLSSVTSPARDRDRLLDYHSSIYKEAHDLNATSCKNHVAIAGNKSIMTACPHRPKPFSHSSTAEEIAAGRDDGKSDYGVGRSKGGGYHANGQGKPKKGRAREAKRMRHSSEPDFDYDDDPDVTL